MGTLVKGGLHRGLSWMILTDEAQRHVEQAGLVGHRLAAGLQPPALTEQPYVAFAPLSKIDSRS